MKDFHKITLAEIRAGLSKGEFCAKDLAEFCKARFDEDEKSEKPLRAFVEFFADSISAAEKIDAEIAEARKAGNLDALFVQKPLLGAPFAVKDNISVRGKPCTCASKILAGYVAPYDSTVVARLLKAGAIPVGRTNMDEFAMGSSTEYSCYGATRNPVNRDFAPGGSSGGSAAAVAAGVVPFALGTETGGSVRLPASFCGLYGYKPTYGALSRWGVVAFGSSLDQVGVFGRNPADIAVPLAVMAGKDELDGTSEEIPVCAAKNSCKTGVFSSASLESLKIAIPKQFANVKGLDSDVSRVFDETKAWFSAQGAQIAEVELPILDASIACYYVLALSEAASNLSRFDGIRYGARKDAGEGYDELYVKTRSEGFGAEVKRRIVIGNYVLSSNFSGDCYKKAMTVRARIQREVGEVLQNFDAILCPVCPTPPFKLGERNDDPLAMYLSDLFTSFVNLARIPAVAFPAGKSRDGLPIGMQIAGPQFSDEKLLQIAQTWFESKK